jgi:hypothetical protein
MKFIAKIRNIGSDKQPNYVVTIPISMVRTNLLQIGKYYSFDTIELNEDEEC